jgi:hypothetical protein
VKSDDPTTPPPPYTEDIDETYGAKPRSQEGDADRLFDGGHEHSWVTPRIALGSGMWSECDVTMILAEGITHVLDCRVSSSECLYVGTPIVYMNCPTADDGDRKDSDLVSDRRWFCDRGAEKTGLENINSLYCRLQSQPVYDIRLASRDRP